MAIYRQNLNTSGTKENLGDPELELIDPTPNVHALFVQFDKRYFWSSLSSVVVRWSKRMYSCAGICRYEGRSGMCDIALSEPLLKLRPRKDLIETLLHEMIHAYLFLTDGDRDRDGHGPNFCKHMHRINKAASINITIYHSFHDEVKLYQTHWWRCDGPCQREKPYFGTVRRTSNRAPGPNDFWWGEHQRRCGGTFIKIKEPENFKARPRNKDKAIPDKSKQPTIKVPDKKPLKNIQPTIVEVLGSKNENILSPVKTEDPSDAANFVRNHWASKSLNGTISKTPKPVKKPEKRQTISPLFNTINSYFPSTSKSLPAVSPESATKILLDIYGDDLLVVKNGEIIQPTKKIKTENDIKIECTNYVNCPSCNVKVKESDINEHLDLCLLEDKSKPVVTDFVDLTVVKQEDDKNCPVCNELTDSIEDHLEDCLSSFDQSIPKEADSSFFEDNDDDLDESRLFNETGTKFPCPVCLTMVESDVMNIHLDQCLNQKY